MRRRLISCPSASMGSGPPGQGDFSQAADRAKMAPVLMATMKRKLLQLLQAQDFVSYRVVLNQQSVYLNGLQEPGMQDYYKPVPGFGGALKSQKPSSPLKPPKKPRKPDMVISLKFGSFLGYPNYQAPLYAGSPKKARILKTDPMVKPP